jgi:two-component system response regulator
MENTDVLLVEDNLDDVELTKRAFQKNNIQSNLVVTRDGVETLDYLFGQGKFQGRDTTNTPKLILLDLKMPKVNGLEVLKQIRSDEHTKYIPVIILTSSRDKNDILAGYELGANSYITKPIDFVKFYQIVQQIAFYWLVLNEQPLRKIGE